MGIRSVLWLLPCQFASGMERTCAHSLSFYRIIGPYNWAKTFYESIRARDVGLVVQLGGDLMFGRFLSRMSGAELFCYTYGRKRDCAVVPGSLPLTRSWQIAFEKVAFPPGDWRSGRRFSEIGY